MTPSAVAKLVTKVPHHQHTVWKDGIDIEECWPDCIRCQLEAALATAPPEQAANPSPTPWDFSTWGFYCDKCRKFFESEELKPVLLEGGYISYEHKTCNGPARYITYTLAQPQATSGGALTAEDIRKAHNSVGHLAFKDKQYAAIAECLNAALASHDQKVREPLAVWMIANSFATGHGDTLEDLLGELKWQIKERAQKTRDMRSALEALAEDMGERCGDHCSNNCRMCIARNALRLILCTPALAAPAVSKPEASKEQP